MILRYVINDEILIIVIVINHDLSWFIFFPFLEQKDKKQQIGVCFIMFHD